MLPTGPYLRYAAMRAEGRVLWSDEYFGGAWVVTRYEDVRAALQEPGLSAQRTGGWVMQPADRGGVARGDLAELQRLFARALLFLDSPHHPRVRQSMQAAFHPSRLTALRPRISAMVEGLLDEIEARHGPDEPFDFIDEFARLLPSRVIAMLLGLETEAPAEFAHWSSQLAAFLGATQPPLTSVYRARDSLLAMCHFFDKEIECRRRQPGGEGLLDILVAAAEAGRIHGATELLAQCAMLLFAGYETTRHSLGTSLYWLLSYPDAWRRLQSDAAVLPRAIRELLRWDSPVQYTGRRAAGDFVLYGQQVRRGDLVVPLIGAANRDPAKYAEPDRLLLDRKVGMPLSFGAGPHVCIGAILTLTELEVAVGRIAQRWPALQLMRGAERWIEQPLYRGLEQLWLCRGTASDCAHLG
jgi:cytochrome P450